MSLPKYIAPTMSTSKCAIAPRLLTTPIFTTIGTKLYELNKTFFSTTHDHIAIVNSSIDLQWHWQWLCHNHLHRQSHYPSPTTTTTPPPPAPPNQVSIKRGKLTMSKHFWQENEWKVEQGANFFHPPTKNFSAIFESSEQISPKQICEEGKKPI